MEYLTAPHTYIPGRAANGDRLGVNGRSLIGMTVIAWLGSLSWQNVHITSGKVITDEMH